jgi:ATP-dependent exoDNAse (exonuclease V) beta subunit
VRLMTVHAAKGLEFSDVFVIRVNAPSFPAKYKEPLFEFPDELRAHAAPISADRKALHDEEERRLFYVAMTRARDNLTLCAKGGKGKNPRPPGYCREILEDAVAKSVTQMRDPRPEQLDLAAAAAPVEILSPIGQWVSLPPQPGLKDAALSASAIGTYKRCPLQFKLQRDWHLPDEATAALRFGSAMHIAMKAYYDGARAGKLLAAEALVAVFREELTKEAIDNPLQARLYDEAGERQLRTFVERQARESLPAVQDTERTFQVTIEGLKINGRMDRVDAVDGGVVITDYKSGRPWDEDMADDSLQLSIYALAARQLGMKPVSLVIHNVENDSQIRTTRSEADLAGAEGEVKAVGNSIAGGDFEPKSGRHCNWCGYRAICPATEQKFFPSAVAAAGA